VSPAFADNGSGIRSFFQKFRQERQDDRKGSNNNIDDTASRSAALLLKHEAERRDRITKFWKKTGERLQKLINREKKIADKIGVRIDRLAAAGRDPAKIIELRSALVAARLKIDAAQTALNDATTQINALVIANKPAEALAKARELHKGVVGKIREAHKALIDVLVSTRGLSVTPTPTPTPTP